MKLIIGLGNPGKKYETTRHNVGFMFVDQFQYDENFSDFKPESKFKADISSGNYLGEKTLLIKPQTYMNLSGESVRAICNFYKLDSDDFIVIYDDISMDFGKIRFRKKGSAGGHNGIKDIIKHFGNEFKRIKVGVGYDSKYEVSDWVLGKFSSKELEEIHSNVYIQSKELLEKEASI